MKILKSKQFLTGALAGVLVFGAGIVHTVRAHAFATDGHPVPMEEMLIDQPISKVGKSQYTAYQCDANLQNDEVARRVVEPGGISYRMPSGEEFPVASFGSVTAILKDKTIDSAEKFDGYLLTYPDLYKAYRTDGTLGFVSDYDKDVIEKYNLPILSNDCPLDLNEQLKKEVNNV
jgi:hypothetical protein